MSISEVELFGPSVEEARRLVEQRLAEYVEFDDQCPTRLASAIAYSLLAGGKRLRPLLVLAGSHVCGGSLPAALPAACAVEMVHAYSLIHDDLPAMDDDDMRRGQPSCHVKFDEATAILAGDALIPLAFEVLARDIKPAECAARCVHELARTAGASQLVGGQSDDLQLQHSDANLVQLEAIHQRKTGALLTTSLRLGCLTAAGSEQQLGALTQYGRPLGLAFQITDDLLDLSGDEVELGKRVGKDSERGKQTYPKLMGIDASRKLARDLADQAIEALNCFGEVANELRRFANFVVERNY